MTKVVAAGRCAAVWRPTPVADRILPPSWKRTFVRRVGQAPVRCDSGDLLNRLAHIEHLPCRYALQCLNDSAGPMHCHINGVNGIS